MHFVISEPSKVDKPLLRVRPGQHRTGTIARSEKMFTCIAVYRVCNAVTRRIPKLRIYTQL